MIEVSTGIVVAVEVMMGNGEGWISCSSGISLTSTMVEVEAIAVNGDGGISLWSSSGTSFTVEMEVKTGD